MKSNRQSQIKSQPIRGGQAGADDEVIDGARGVGARSDARADGGTEGARMAAARTSLVGS